jgi:Flp pilus assembly pilin Flp
MSTQNNPMDTKTSTEFSRKDKKERGAGLVEFSVLVALVAVVTIVSVRNLGLAIVDKVSESKEALEYGACGDVWC